MERMSREGERGVERKEGGEEGRDRYVVHLTQERVHPEGAWQMPY